MKKFIRHEKYQTFSKEVNGVLMYSGGILPEDTMNGVVTLTTVMRDLTTNSFCVPVIDKHSLIAYSIFIHCHWNNNLVKHSGIETTLCEI